MSNVYTGRVQGLSKIATGTASAFCRAVLGGSLSLNPSISRRFGIAGQVVARKGTNDITLDWNCIGPAKTDSQLWFPTSAAVQVASFPDFLVDVDDGTHGQEWVLSGGQPASCEISCPMAADGQVEYHFTAKFTTATEAAVGSDVPVYNSVLGHTINDTILTIGDTGKGAMSFNLKNDLAPAMYNAMDTKVAGSRSIPQGYVITKYDPSISIVTSEVLEGATFDADTYTPLAIVLALTNGTAGENVTITLSDFIPNSWNMPLEAEGIIGFAHEYGMGSGNAYNRVVFT